MIEKEDCEQYFDELNQFKNTLNSDRTLAVSGAMYVNYVEHLKTTYPDLVLLDAHTVFVEWTNYLSAKKHLAHAVKIF